MIESSQKKRHEILDDKIRASYGHSLKSKIIKENSTPPKYLYHATKNSILENIFNKGLLPMERQYVHLSENKKDAFTVALRKTSRPIVLRVQSKLANEQGINFYKEKDSLWLSDNIDSKYLEVDKD
jgi:putative RNA 2'-phosphotransferase